MKPYYLFLGVILCLTFCLLPYPGNTQNYLEGLTKKHLSWQDISRNYFLHIPPQAQAGHALPLVIVLHGGGGSAEGLLPILLGKFDELSDRDGFIIAYPNAVNNSWNDGRVVHRKPEQLEVDDVGFLTLLIQTIQEDFKIDAQRIFIAGISNGGWMTARMLCERSELIRGGAMVAATTSDDYFPQCQPVEGVGVLVMNGTKDPLLPYEGGITGRWWIETELSIMGTDKFIDYWVNQNSCEDKVEAEFLANKAQFDGTRVQVNRYRGCEKNNEVVLYKIIGGGHSWPGGKHKLPAWVIGKTSKDINGCEEIWAFFKSLSPRR